ncbi:hypothetical protein L1281_002438 [Neisseria sp. HSC-16F19]|nr:hypothetical protein [Neisseria sp. HSC-16F19]MCP2041821.1 hypothetical protein [Neisseria sp. HSC-16F19]
MNKALLACMLAAALPAAALANDTDARLRRLETEVIRLQERVNMLERMLQHGQSGNNHVYVCRIQAFAEVYEGESTNAGVAKRQAQTACLKEQAALFCRTQNIQCVRY